MKQRTANMFAETCEDLPLFSGMEYTEVVQWNKDGTDGYCNECVIAIRPTVGGEYRVEVFLHDYFANTHETLALSYEATLEQAQLYAIQVANP